MRVFLGPRIEHERTFIVIWVDPNDTTRSTVDSDGELNNSETIHRDDEQCLPVKMN